MKKQIKNFTIKSYPGSIRIFEQFEDKESNFYLINCEDSAASFQLIKDINDVKILISNE